MSFTAPFYLMYAGDPEARMCMQADTRTPWAYVRLQKMSASSDLQLWQFNLSAGGGLWLFDPEKPNAPSLPLTTEGVANGSLVKLGTNGPNITQWAYNYDGRTNCLIYWGPVGEQWFVVDNDYGSTAPDTKIQLWEYAGGNPNQKWVLSLAILPVVVSSIDAGAVPDTGAVGNRINEKSYQ